MNFGRQRFVIGLFLTAAIIMFLTLAANISLTWRENARLSARARDNTQWGATQLETQILKLANALDQYGHRSKTVRLDDVILRTELLWSRLDFFKEGEAQQVFIEIKRAQEHLKTIRDQLVDFEKRIHSLKENDPLLAFTIAGEVTKLAPLAHDIGLETFHHFNNEAVTIRGSFQQSMRESLVYMTGILFCGLVIGWLWIIQTRRVNAFSRARDEALMEARTASRAKTDFLASMNHELRTPLNAIKGFSYLLETMTEDKLSEKQKEYIGYIAKSGAYLEELIGQVLDLSDIESGNLDISTDTFNLSEVVDECLIIAAPMIQEGEITIIDRLEARKLSDITSDRTRVKQVLMNLISNAIKYNNHNGMVIIDADTPTKGMVRIIIEDNGPGIPEEKVDRLFEPFDRLGREALKIEGMGIGLSICKKIIAALNGEMGVDTISGVGCKFWVTLPTQPKG